MYQLFVRFYFINILYLLNTSLVIFEFINLSFGGNTKGQYVYKIAVVRGKPFYGFDPMQKIYFKVFFYDPGLGNIFLHYLFRY